MQLTLNVSTEAVQEVIASFSEEVKDIVERLRWRDASHELPEEGHVVVIKFYNGNYKIAAIFTDHPGFEDNYQSYQYFDDPINDGQGWEMDDIVSWKYIE